MKSHHQKMKTMEPFKNQIVLFLLLGSVWANTICAQSYSNSKLTRIPMDQVNMVKIMSDYTNLELEKVEGNDIVVEAHMEIDGLSQEEAKAYFDQWKIHTDINNGMLSINPYLKGDSNTDWQKQGYYEGYFLNKDQLAAISDDIEAFKKIEERDLEENKTASYDKIFDMEAYIEQGDAYLLKWQKKNHGNIGKRWFNKTREQRIDMMKKPKSMLPDRPTKETIPQKDQKLSIAKKVRQEAKLKKVQLPDANVRPLKKRTVIKRTLKVGIPYGLAISMEMKHGKVLVSNELNLLSADLKYVLFEAESIGGHNTTLKGRYSNFEIGHWKSGTLDIAFSDFVLINRVEELSVTSNSSVVAIDTVSKQIFVQGNYKMLSLDLAPTFSSARIDVVDSKKVWLKLPDTQYNLHYSGRDSKLLHPDKFTLKQGGSPSEKVLESTPMENNARSIHISSLSSTMQIYDTPWENLKIKSLEEL